jgi:hypothetical protein
MCVTDVCAIAAAGAGHIDDIESIVIKLFGVPYMAAEDTRDLIGLHSVPLDDVMDKEKWEMSAVGQEQWTVKEELTVAEDGHTEAAHHFYSLREKHPDKIDEEHMFDAESPGRKSVREVAVDAALNPVNTTFNTVRTLASTSAALTKQVVPIRDMNELQLIGSGAGAGVEYTVTKSVGAATDGANL